VAKVVKDGDGLDDTGSGFFAKGRHTRCHYCDARRQVLSKLIIERANALGSRVHVILRLGCVKERQARIVVRAKPRG
jgi:hypothetical protein